MQLLKHARAWLSHCVIEHHEADRPFRLRRLSVLLLIGGWVSFLLSVVIGLGMARNHLPLLSVSELFQGTFVTASLSYHETWIAGLWAMHALQLVGAVIFFIGLGSVAMFDLRDTNGLCRSRS